MYIRGIRNHAFSPHRDDAPDDRGAAVPRRTPTRWRPHCATDVDDDDDDDDDDDEEHGEGTWTRVGRDARDARDAMRELDAARGRCGEEKSRAARGRAMTRSGGDVRARATSGRRVRGGG